MNYYSKRKLNQIQELVDTRLETLFESMHELFPNEPYVRRGEWSWHHLSGVDRRIDLMFHYFPVCFIILSPLDTDMNLCTKLLGKGAWEERQRSLEVMRSRAEEVKCPMILAYPEDTLSTIWVKDALDGKKPMLLR